jgi:hypothetical protein
VRQNGTPPKKHLFYPNVKELCNQLIINWLRVMQAQNNAVEKIAFCTILQYHQNKEVLCHRRAE